jgi:hypothetical protein
VKHNQSQTSTSHGPDDFVGRKAVFWKGDRSVRVAGRHAGDGGALVGGGGALGVDGHVADLHCWLGREVCEEVRLVVMLDAGVDVPVRWNVCFRGHQFSLGVLLANRRAFICL